jgi:hypothetical protein
MSSTESSAQPARLVPAMGTWALAASVVNLTVGGGIFRHPAASVVPWLALAVIAFLLTSVTRDEWAVVAGVVVISTAIFFVTRGSRAASAAAVES